VLLRENLVEERLFKGASPITIGQSLRCNLSIPADGMPHDHALFVHDQGRLLLRLTTGMTGRLAQGGTISTELLQGAGDHGVWTIPVERGARGKLQIGEATILFQEMAAPPATRPQLPASVRGTFGDRIDRRLAVIVAASLLAHLTIATWAWMTDREVDPKAMETLAEYQPPQYQIVDMTIPTEPTPPPTQPPTEPGIATPATPTQVAKPIVPRIRPDRMPDPIDPDAWARVITGNTRGPNGEVEVGNRQPGTALEKQIADVTDRNRNVKPGTEGNSRDPNAHLGTGPTGPEIADPSGLTQTNPAHEEKPIRIVLVPRDPKKKRGEGPTLTVDMVLDKINNTYITGLQRCYRLDLVHDASLTGKIALAFTVDEKGATTEIDASGTTSTLDACVNKAMTSWRFPIPRDNTGSPTDAPFKLSLVLRSN
jgi:outer membrane biosynthesis protein TonB